MVAVTTTKTQLNTNGTCKEVLARATNILNLFQRDLQNVCIGWDKIPILQILELFSDVRSAETDVHALKHSIEANIVPYLLAILQFWKQRSHLQNIYDGINKLVNQMQISLDENSICGINILKNLLAVNEQTLGKLCFDHYQRYISVFDDKYSSKILNLWSQYSLSDDVVKFLAKLTPTEMDNLLEAVNDWDDTLISTRTVMDFAILKAFFDRVYAMTEEIRQKKVLATLDYISQCFGTILQAKEFQQVVELLPTCSASLPAIQRLYLDLTDKDKSKRQRIIDIMQKTAIVFKQNPSKKYEFNVCLQPQNLTFVDLSELRDRTRLIQYSNENKSKKGTELRVEKLHHFITFVDTIELILKTLSSLFIAGHPMITNYSWTEKFTCIDGQFDELQRLCTKLEKDLGEWEQDLCHIYERYPELTHFFCEHFYEIEQTIYHDNNKSNGFHLLKYIGFEPEQLQQTASKLKPEIERPVEHLEHIGRLLATRRVVLQKNISGRKLWLVETIEDWVLRAIFSLFHSIKSPVRVHQLFYCTERTNWIEIRAFIYRCFFSQTLQILVRPHLLSSDIQDRFLPLLRQLIERDPIRSFCLGIISTTSIQNIQLINALKQLNIITTLHDKDLLNKVDLANQVKPMLHYCTLVTSRLAGLGKTSLIREQCQRMNKSLIKFPIGGDVQPDKLAQRLNQYTKALHNSVLHIDIGPVDNIRMLDEILYCLTLFHSIRFGQIAVSLPLNTHIFIELDSSPFSINQENLTICQYVESVHHIERIQWNELHHHLPKIQFVANYLDAINVKTIIKSNMNEGTMQAIDAEKCRQLIQKSFTVGKDPQFITWTQLNIFIAVFYSLFEGFSKCGHFLIDCLNNPQLRLDILQALLRSSDQFTSLSVENVRKQQRISSTIEDDIIVQPMTLSDTVIQWETTQPFTVVFTATYDPLFVYKTVRDVPQSLIDSFREFQQASTSQKTRTPAAKAPMMPEVAPIVTETFSEVIAFPNHNELSHVQFFLKLASLSHKFFNKAVCGKCFQQFPYNTQRCASCATNDELLKPNTFDYHDIILYQSRIATLIESQYVLTPDNYIKMLLVFLRVQSGLPVLIMGETGNLMIIKICFFQSLYNLCF